jgi:sugar lactone lactonase YvrE
VLDGAFPTADAGRDGGLRDASSDPALPRDGGLDAGAPEDASAAAQVDAHTEGAGPDAGPDASADAGPLPCPDGFPRGVPGLPMRQVEALAPAPEGVASCPDGTLFVSRASSGAVWKLGSSGAKGELWADLPGRQLAGITCDEQNRLFVADFGGPLLPAPKALVLVTGRGQAGPINAPTAGPEFQGLNGIVAVPGRGVFVSDTVGARLFQCSELSPGTFRCSVRADDLSGANGLAYERRTGQLYVALMDVLGADSRVVRFDVGPAGTLTDRTEVWQGQGVLDGIAIDERGGLYGALNDRDVVVELETGSVLMRLPKPASLAFRGSVLYATSYDAVSSNLEWLTGIALFDGGVSSLELGVCGG